jgi:dienelactone hydrolase
MPDSIRTLAIALLLLAPLRGIAQDDGPAQELFVPKSQKAPVVVLLSGASGTTNYRYYGEDLAKLGYYAVLVEGKSILMRQQQEGEQNLRKVIARAQASPNAVPGKVVVVGFSQGGGGALAHAVVMPELVSAAVAYYPSISWAAKNIGGLAARIKVPVLVLAGEADRYNNCCLIEHMRELDAAARAQQLPLELVVYANTDHGFNLWGRAYRSDVTEDAWRRTKEMLVRYLPLQ